MNNSAHHDSLVSFSLLTMLSLLVATGSALADPSIAHRRPTDSVPASGERGRAVTAPGRRYRPSRQERLFCLAARPAGDRLPPAPRRLLPRPAYGPVQPSRQSG